MKKLLTMFILIAMVFTMLSAVVNADECEIEVIHVRSDYPYYDTIDELFEYATLVIKVEVLNDGVARMINIAASLPEPVYSLFTVHQLRVIEVFKGDVQIDDVIEVRQLGGELDGTLLINDSKISFETGDKFVLCLLWNDRNTPAGLLSPWQAVYHVIDGELVSLEGNSLTLTWEDLERLRDGYFNRCEECDEIECVCVVETTLPPVDTTPTPTPPTPPTDNNPPTGVALAVIPVVSAALAVFVMKKRK